MAITTSILTGGVNNHQTTSEEANAVYTDFASEGIVGTLSNTSGVAPATGGFAVNAQGTPDTTIAISAGVAYVTGTPTSQASQTFRVRNTASTNLTVSANSSGSTKYDWIYIKLDATTLNAPNTAGDDVATIVASRSSNSTTDDGTPPTYGYPIAVVTVANGFSTITNGNIRDVRVATGMTPIASAVSTASWASLGSTPSSVVYNGNRSYTLTHTGVDLTTDVSPGMRIKATRTETAPTQCSDLEASTSQYYSKTSPAGMTFTDDFVVSAWVKLESYPASLSTIASRYNGTSGWRLELTDKGIIQLVGLNGGSGNFSLVDSYQSVPLGKWVHVAAQLDMSAFTATTTTSYVMIDGVDVPATVVRSGTNPTALIQAGNLEIGGQNTGTFTFDGKLAQVAIYSAKVTQATIRASVSQGLVGSETSLISAYSFDNSINDLNTSNANNLTANASAVATSSDSPYASRSDLVTGVTAGTTEYGIVTKVSFSTDTTLVVQVPEGGALPTTGGVSAISYSSQKAPYGFLVDRGRWFVDTYIVANLGTVSISALNQWFSLNTQLTIPIGAWELGYQVHITSTGATNVTQGTVLLAPATPTNADRKYELAHYWDSLNTAQTNFGIHFSREAPITLTSATAYLFYAEVINNSGATTVTLRGDVGFSVIRAKCTYL